VGVRNLHLACVLSLGCYPALTPDDVCAELVHAVALRTLECTGDQRLADARGQTMEAAGCVATTVDEPVWDCPRAAYAASCTAVEAQGDDPDFWAGQDAACAMVVDLGTATTPSTPRPRPTTPPVTIPVDEGPGSCLDPLVEELTGPGQSAVWTLDEAVGDSVDYAPACLTAGPSRDLAVSLTWDDTAPLELWASATGGGEVAVSMLAPRDTCAGALVSSCTLVPSDGSWVPITQGPGLGGEVEALFVVSVADPEPGAAGTVVAELLALPVGEVPP